MIRTLVIALALVASAFAQPALKLYPPVTKSGDNGETLQRLQDAADAADQKFGDLHARISAEMPVLENLLKSGGSNAAIQELRHVLGLYDQAKKAQHEALGAGQAAIAEHLSCGYYKDPQKKTSFDSWLHAHLAKVQFHLQESDYFLMARAAVKIGDTAECNKAMAAIAAKFQYQQYWSKIYR